MNHTQLSLQRKIIKEEYITEQEVSQRAAEIKDQLDTKKRGGCYGRSKNQSERK